MLKFLLPGGSPPSHRPNSCALIVLIVTSLQKKTTRIFASTGNLAALAFTTIYQTSLLRSLLVPKVISEESLLENFAARTEAGVVKVWVNIPGTSFRT